MHKAVPPCAVAVGSAIYVAFLKRQADASSAARELAFLRGGLSSKVPHGATEYVIRREAHTYRYIARPRDCVLGRYCHGCSRMALKLTRDFSKRAPK